MASFLTEEFIGNGVLKGLVPKLVEEGWDDIPTLKLMNPEDMDAMNMNQKQKDALEIRSYLHDRALMRYGDKLEASGKTLLEILNMTPQNLSSEFSMKRGHIARFRDGTSNSCVISMPPSYVLPARRRTPSRSDSIQGIELRSPIRNVPPSVTRSYTRGSRNYNYNYNQSLEKSLSEIKIKDGHVFKGIVAAEPAGNRSCGCVEAPDVLDDNVLAPYSAIEHISVQKLTPEYKIGMEHTVKTKTTPPMKASELWRDKPAILLCIRRPGCIMCRAEAHQLYARKPIFDALGFQLIAVLHEQINSEVKDFWPRYWGGVVIHDREMGFFKALGGGKLLKDKFIKGFILNPKAIANYKRAKAMGLDQNFKGEGEIKGGLFIVGSGTSGIAYQFIERNFGDWAPIGEVIEICTRIDTETTARSKGAY